MKFHLALTLNRYIDSCEYFIGSHLWSWQKTSQHDFILTSKWIWCNPNLEIHVDAHVARAWQLMANATWKEEHVLEDVLASRKELAMFFRKKKPWRRQCAPRLWGRICIGRLMCSSPHPCFCFHVTTAWQPRKWDTGTGKKGLRKPSD